MVVVGPLRPMLEDVLRVVVDVTDASTEVDVVVSRWMGPGPGIELAPTSVWSVSAESRSTMPTPTREPKPNVPTATQASGSERMLT